MPDLQDRLEEISNNGNFRKVWSRVKDVIIDNEDLSKEGKLTLAKLYKEFNQGLSEELAKFEKAKSTVSATKHANRAIEIIKSYEDKFEEVKNELPAVASMGIGGLLQGLRVYLSKSLNQIGMDDMGAAVKIKEIANDAKLHKIWSKVKKGMLENDDLDKDDKKALKKLYESFDGGLSAVIKKFEKADSDDEAIKYANEAIEVIKEYVKKVKAMGKDLPGNTSIALSGLLEEIQSFLEEWLKKVS